MASEYGDVFAAAIAVAISPVPIVAVILILFSEHSRRNGILYLLGWVLGLLICIGAVLILPEGLDFNRGSTLATAGATLRLVTGLLFVAAAFAVWLRRPKTGEAHPLPAWTNRIEGFSGVQALLLAIGLAVINPKNLALAFSVILSIAEAGAPAGAARAWRWRCLSSWAASPLQCLCSIVSWPANKRTSSSTRGRSGSCTTIQR